MWKKMIITLLGLGCWGMLCAQTQTDSLRERYESNPRDMKVVREYMDALQADRQLKETERVVREYMARCPVLQVEDKDTYLLLNRYVFENPYSNVFEYGIYAMKKMKWERTEKRLDNRQERLLNIFKGLGSGVSGDEEIDKRYEVLMILSRNLNSEIDRLCCPVYEEKKYSMPDWDSVKIRRLEYLVNKGELLGQDGMRLKLAVRRALQEGDYSGILQNLCVAARLDVIGIRGNYTVGMMNVLLDRDLQKAQIHEALQLILQLNGQAEQQGKKGDYYTILGRLYHRFGDNINGDKYTRMGETVEAEKMARFQELMKNMNRK